MGIDAHSIPPKMRRYMPAEHPESAAAQDRRHAAYEAKLEREMHEEFTVWLTQHAPVGKLPFIHSRMDKPSTIREGWPDFTVFWNRRACAIEFKLPDNQPTDAQRACAADLWAAGVPVIVAYNVKSAIEFVNRTLLEKET